MDTVNTILVLLLLYYYTQTKIILHFDDASLPFYSMLLIRVRAMAKGAVISWMGAMSIFYTRI